MQVIINPSSGGAKVVTFYELSKMGYTRFARYDRYATVIPTERSEGENLKQPGVTLSFRLSEAKERISNYLSFKHLILNPYGFIVNSRHDGGDGFGRDAKGGTAGNHFGKELLPSACLENGNVVAALVLAYSP